MLHPETFFQCCFEIGEGAHGGCRVWNQVLALPSRAHGSSDIIIVVVEGLPALVVLIVFSTGSCSILLFVGKTMFSPYVCICFTCCC